MRHRLTYLRHSLDLLRHYIDQRDISLQPIYVTNTFFLPPMINRGREKQKYELPQSSSHTSDKMDGSVVAIRVIRWKMIVVSFITWFMLIHYFERTNTRSVINSCHWGSWETWEKDAQPHRVALVADPQIVDDHSYAGRPRLLDYLLKKVTDNYLYRNHKYVQSYLDPDTVIFLGDLFDGGREWENKMWYEEYLRFNRIFPKKINRRTINSIPGNHDIGFESISPDVVNRFRTFFGEPNDYIVIGNHSIVMLDTISLSHPNPEIHTAPTAFLETINDKLNPQLPRILLLHVPLYRFTETQACGPLREKSGPFPVQKGKQYQTVIEYEISQRILRTIHPEIAFAGDDHDYCDINQPYIYNGKNKITREIAVKSAAMSSGIKRPAIQLLSLNNPYDPRKTDSTLTYQTEMCYMPDPYFPFKIYLGVFLVSLTLTSLMFLYPRKLEEYVRKCELFLRQNSPVTRLPWNFHNIQRDPTGFWIHMGIQVTIPFFILYLYYITI